MIQARDLMLNNAVMHNGIICFVSWIQEKSIAVEYNERQPNLINGAICSECSLEPIPAGMKELNLLGFKFDGDMWVSQDVDLITAPVIGSESSIILTPNRKFCMELKYVHQIQNLVYLMTNKELTYKP